MIRCAVPVLLGTILRAGTNVLHDQHAYASFRPTSPPDEMIPGLQTVWLGSNSFWSANTYGADGTGGNWVPPSGAPFPHCEVSPPNHTLLFYLLLL